MKYPGLVLVLAFGVATRTPAADGRLIDDDTFAVTSKGPLAIDGGLVVATPSALPSGLSTGFGAGVTHACGCRFAYGARFAWSTVTESSVDWSVTQQDFRLRVFGALRHAFGRGEVMLRLGAGPTIVHEARTRSQAMRAGRSDLDTSATAALPAVDLEGVVALHVAGPWVAVLNAGPSIDRTGGAFHGGWIIGLGVAWQP